jgi:hypothetical protein
VLAGCRRHGVIVGSGGIALAAAAPALAATGYRLFVGRAGRTVTPIVGRGVRCGAFRRAIAVAAAAAASAFGGPFGERIVIVRAGGLVARRRFPVAVRL